MVLSQADKEQVGRILSEMEKEVTVILFKHPDFELSDVNEELLNDIAEVAPKFKFRLGSEEEAKKLGINGLALVFEGFENIRYYGTPSGHEFRAFLDDILMISKGKTDLDEHTIELIKSLDRDIEVLVFVTPTCPYCPIAVRGAHKFAFINKNLKGFMVEAVEYPQWADQYKVYAVPKIVVRVDGEDKIEWEGAMPDHAFAHRIAEALQ